MLHWQACFQCREVYCSDRSAAFQHRAEMACGTLDARQCLLYGRPGGIDYLQQSRRLFFPDAPAGLSALNPPHGYSCISIPGAFPTCWVSYRRKLTDTCTAFKVYATKKFHYGTVIQYTVQCCNVLSYHIQCLYLILVTTSFCHRAFNLCLLFLLT